MKKPNKPTPSPRPRTTRALDHAALREVHGGAPYQQITWTFATGGIMAGDDWEKPN